VSGADGGTLTQVVAGLDRWFDASRVDWPTPGYGGPVVHWWNHGLAFRGSGLDWRYEGIVDGYLALWRRSGDEGWLAKAVRAGDDLIAGQFPCGSFSNSRFELNPGAGGTPHEAACVVALLLLAAALRETGRADGERYLAAAEAAFHGFLVGRLWNPVTRTLRDAPGTDSFVPNKAATFCEAVLALAALTRDDGLVARFAAPTGDRILAMQKRHPNDPLDGAIAQNRFGDRVVESFFPLYVARCVPALLKLTEATGEDRYRAGALAAARFVARVREADGGLPQVLYPRGRRNRNPRWIAGAGDVVRALTLARAYDPDLDPRPTMDWIVRGARPDGRIAAAEGFGKVLPLPWLAGRAGAADEAGVVGWCDKAFRALAPLADPSLVDRCGKVEPPTTFEMQGIVR
jgi:hypothetical protein